MESRINWNEPSFGEEELRQASEVIKNNYVNEGPKAKELEEKLRNYLGVKHVVLTTNATAGLFLALKADALIKEIDYFQVIVPDMTMIATATAVNWAGGEPVLVDVENKRGTIDVSKIEEKMNATTSAIVPVHILGRSADMEALNEMASDYNLSIIEDAAGALGSSYNGKLLGALGKVGVYSLQSNKIITSGQGGIIVTDDDKYYETIRRLRDFGRFSNKEFLHNEIGYNLKFNDWSAALALGQFGRLDERKKLLLDQKILYENKLKGLEEISFFENYEGEVPLWVDCIAKNRKDLVSYLNCLNIYPRECWPAIHKNNPYKNQGDDKDFPNATFFSDNCLWLPNGPAIKEEQINLITEKIRGFYERTRTK